MIFETAYYHPMDKEYKDKPLDGLGVKDIGMSVPLGIAAGDVQGVNAKIKSGAGSLEIQFAGAGRGQRQQQTPGMWGKENRQALEELSRVNEVNLTTHTTFAVGGLAGQDQQGNFSEEQRKFAIDEIKRAVEFAADTAKGGSVVVHTGEFTRPISEETWAEEGEKFRGYEKEPEMTVKRVIDIREGRVHNIASKNKALVRPRYHQADHDYDFVDRYGVAHQVKKGSYLDRDGRPISRENVLERVPIFNEDGSFETETKVWKDFEQEANQWNENHPDDQKTPEEIFYKTQIENNIARSKGMVAYYTQYYEKYKKDRDKILDAIQFYEKIESNTPEEEKWKIRKVLESQEYAGLVPPEIKDPTEFLKEKLTDVERHLKSSDESAATYEAEAKQHEVDMGYIKSVEKYALDKSYDSYAQAGMYAMELTKRKHLDNPLTITMENIFPEQYGSHPEELKSLINKSRERMTDMLVTQKGYSESDAKSKANEHIRATLDTGHINTWRKYYQGSDKEFKNWLLKQTEDLAKSDIIGNVHLSDNFGYQDDHLAPGQGTTPVKEMMEILRKHGYKGPMTVEPGADASTDLSDFHGLMKTWRYFGSPIYGIGAPARLGGPSNWDQVQYGYFGRTYPPNFIFGAYSPSNDWTLWSQVPME